MEREQHYDEIALTLYLTPQAPSDESPVDPRVELEEMEHEKEAERRAALALEKPREDAGADQDATGLDYPSGDDSKDTSSSSESGDSSSTTDVDAATSEDIRSVTDSEDTASPVTPSPDARESDDDAPPADIESEETEDDDEGFELLWSGHAPQWVRDADADAANALLVHACGCAVPRACRDADYGALCLPMKRFLRSACWASHNATWRAGAAASRLAALLAYHALHCNAAPRAACTVPLCAAFAP